MTVQWLNAEEIARATDVRRGFLEMLSVANEKIVSSDPEVSIGEAYSLKMIAAEPLGVVAWLLDENADEARHYFRMVAETRLEWIEERGPLQKIIMRPVGDRVVRETISGECRHLEKSSPQSFQSVIKKLAKALDGEIVDTEYGKGVVFTDYRLKAGGADKSVSAMQCGLAAGDTHLAKRVAEQSIGPKDFGPAYSIEISYTQALWYVLLGDEPNGRKSLTELAKVPGALYRRLGNAYSALLDNDAAGVQKEFKAYLAEFRKKAVPPKLIERYRGKVEPPVLIDFEFLLSIPGLAFCNLAASRGIKLEVDEPFLPKQLQNG